MNFKNYKGNFYSMGFKRRLKKEYRKTMDRLVRSHALHTFFIRSIYLIGFVISMILGALLYLD